MFENPQSLLTIADFFKRAAIVIGINGKILDANAIFQKEIGYDRGILTSLNILALDKSLTPQKWKQLLEKMPEQKSLSRKTHYITADGQSYPVNTLIVFLQDAHQPLCCIFSEKITLEQDRREYLRKFSLQNISDVVIGAQPDGSIFYANAVCSEKLGYSESQLQKMNLVDLLDELTPEIWRQQLKELRRQGVLRFDRAVINTSEGQMNAQITIHSLEFKSKGLLCLILQKVDKPNLKTEELQATLKEVKEVQQQLEKDHQFLLEEILVQQNISGIISRNRQYRKVLKQVEKVAGTDANVLIEGETGTGKELLAVAIHNLSQRRARPLIKVNCATITKELAESELFGHEKGAFTGAYQRKIGRFEVADKGTLFLDEIGELPLSLQPKLLRVLQEGEFERVGGRKTIKVDVRIIAATNRNLEDMIRENKFREDLYYRLSVFPLYNPPLRERKDDIPLLIKHFIDKFNRKMGKNIKQIPQEDMERLLKYDFPGNIRELENLIERAIILSKEETLYLKNILPNMVE